MPLVVHADDDENSRSSLRGLNGVRVIIESLPPEVLQNGLTIDAIQTDVELKLRQAGIAVLDRSSSDAYLDVSLDFVTASDSFWSHIINVKVLQAAVLARDPSILVPLAYTWGVGSFGTVRKLNVRSLRDDVKDQIDRFINAYLAVNAKK